MIGWVIALVAVCIIELCWQLQVDAAYQEEMLYKQQLLQTRRDQVLGEMDCAEVRAH